MMRSNAFLVVALAAVAACGGGGDAGDVAGVFPETGFIGRSRELLARIRTLVNQANPPWRIDTVNDSLRWAMTAPVTEIPTANGNDPLALERYMQVRLSLVGTGARWGRSGHNNAYPVRCWRHRTNASGRSTGPGCSLPPQS